MSVDPSSNLKPPMKREKSKLELLEESLSSIIDNMSFSSNEMDHSAAVVETESRMHSALKPNVLALNIATPVQTEFNDDDKEECKSKSFEELLSNSGYSSYITDFEQTGVTTLSELIRFATQHLPPSMNITPAPNEDGCVKTEEFPYKEEEEEVKRKGRNKKRKLRLYEVEELLDDDVYCEYALLIRDGGNASINGYYTCSGKKNDHYMFSHMSDELAALYWAKNGTWMIVYDDELLYGNPLKYDSVGGRDILMLAELNLYPPPPRCWYAIEGMNPPPGVMWMEITDDPMAWLDDDLAARCKERNLNEQYMNKLKVDLPVQMIDFMFCGPIGFALRIDGDSKVMDVIRVRDDGQAKQLGLMHGDTLLRINEEEISKKPEIAFPLLKQCVLSDVAFEVTFLRKKFDELVIDVRRAGSAGCNGKYVFFRLDEFDAPIFVKDNDRETWRICRLDHDDEEGQSIWAIQNMTDNTEYYIGYSDSYSPPNNAWETVEEVAANPAPGLQFIAIDNQMMKKLVPDMPKIRQNIFVATKRRRGKAMNANAFDEAKILEEDTTLDSFKLAVFEAQERERSISATPAGTPSPRDGFNLARTDSIMSTASVYAIPDEVQGALVDYQSQIAGLEKELKAERKRALTLTHQHKTHQSVLKEHEEKLQTEKQGFDQQIEWFRHELYTVNNAYYELWIKQSDARLDFHKINKESHKMKGKFAQTKKQLFQAKRKIDDLVDDLDDAQRELDQNTAHHAADKTEQDLASLVSLNRKLDLLTHDRSTNEVAKECQEFDYRQSDDDWRHNKKCIGSKGWEVEIAIKWSSLKTKPPPDRKKSVISVDSRRNKEILIEIFKQTSLQHIPTLNSFLFTLYLCILYIYVSC
eukprot:107882_1